MLNLDISEMFTLVAGSPLVPLVMALVAYIKKFGVQGHYLTASSFGIGLILGVGYYAISVPMVAPEVVTLYWVKAVVYGVILGLMASGLYDMLKGMVGAGLKDFAK